MRSYSQSMSDPQIATSPKCHPRTDDDVLADGGPFPVYRLEHLPARNQRPHGIKEELNTNGPRYESE